MPLNSFAALPASRPLALFSCLLVLKMGAMAFATANARRKEKLVINPEDVGVNPGSRADAQDGPETARVKRAHHNDAENIPGFLGLAMVFTLVGGSATAGWAYFATYFVARTLHSFFYLGHVQPWRTAAFALGQVAQLGLMVQILLKVFR